MFESENREEGQLYSVECIGNSKKQIFTNGITSTQMGPVENMLIRRPHSSLNSYGFQVSSLIDQTQKALKKTFIFNYKFCLCRELLYTDELALEP